MKKRLTLALSLLFMVTLAMGATPTGKVTFAVLADTHIGSSDTALEDLKRSVEDINKNTDIEFVVIDGDVTEFGSDAEILLAHQVLSTLNKTWFALPGNHDAKWSESGCNTYDQVFGSSHFSYQKGGYLFAGCASGPNMRMGPGQVPRGDLNWVKELMQSVDKETPIIFFNHYPFDKELANWDEMMTLLKSGNTQMLLAGHYHNNRPINAEGIPNIICRSNLRANKPVGGYNIVTIENGTATFAERITGVETRPVWHSQPLKRYDAKADTTTYPRPDYSINQKYPSAKIVWQIQDKNDVGAGVATDGKSLVYTNTAGEVKSLRLTDGKELWSYKTNGKIFSTPDIADGRVVVASTDSLIYCLDLKNGKKLWSYKTGRSSVACPVIEGGNVFVGGSDGKFLSLSLKTGAANWVFDGINGFVEARALVDEQKVYIGSWGSELYALDKKTGELRWKWNNGKGRGLSPAACWPVKANGKIFVATPERFATALNAETGAVIWHSGVPGNREALGLSQDGSKIYLKNMQDVFSAVSTTANEPKVEWQQNVGYGYEIAPTVITSTDKLIFLPTGTGNIYAIDAEGKGTIWVKKISNTVINHVLPIGTNQVATSTMDGKVALIQY